MEWSLQVQTGSHTGERGFKMDVQDGYRQDMLKYKNQVKKYQEIMGTGMRRIIQVS